MDVCLKNIATVEQINCSTYNVGQINSIAYKYPDLRQNSKPCTFALQYGGSWHTLVKNLGLVPKEAKKIENNYHELYKESDIWTENQIKFANENSYVQCAFGLRLRTPILGRTIRTKTTNLSIADKEARSAVNAITQSWGMLINRTAIAVIDKIIYSDWYDKIYPINTIHDSIYFIFKNDLKTIQWLNNTLIKEMQWNDHSSIKSTDVPMRAELSIGKNWLSQYILPNDASTEEIITIRNKI